MKLAELFEEREVWASKIADAPAWSPTHAESDYKIGHITFSASRGLGSVSNSSSVYYFGFVTMLTPSEFLSLAHDDRGHQEQTSKELEKLVQDGYAVGVPFLTLYFKNGKPKITGHEGRGRMRMIRRVNGDTAIPVHVFLSDGLRSRNITDEMIDAMKSGVTSEDGSSKVKFTKIFVNGEAR